MKEPPHHVTHEEQRNQDSHQRDSERHKREADLLRAVQGGLQRRLALLPVAGDVLHHHDGVIDHEAGGDGERHQAEVVERIIG